jgi:hypothetical protein
VNYNFFYDKKAGCFQKLGPRAGPGSPTLEFAGTGGDGEQFYKIRGGQGQPNITGSSPLPLSPTSALLPFPLPTSPKTTSPTHTKSPQRKPEYLQKVFIVTREKEEDLELDYYDIE